MASTNNVVTNATQLTPNNPENQQATSPNTSGLPEADSPMPSERKTCLSQHSKAAVDKKYEAQRANLERKYAARCERLEMTYNSEEHPKRRKKQLKLDGSHNKRIDKVNRKHDKALTKKDNRVRQGRPEETTAMTGHDPPAPTIVALSIPEILEGPKKHGFGQWRPKRSVPTGPRVPSFHAVVPEELSQPLARTSGGEDNAGDSATGGGDARRGG